MPSVRESFKVAVSQFSCSGDRESNISKAEALVRNASEQGCHMILLQELFSSLYFCQEESPKHFATALPADLEQNDLLFRMSNLAKELHIIIPVSFFEQRNHVFFNSILVFDADGSVLGIPSHGETPDAVYRKVHIPTGPGYEEKYYFSPAPKEGGGFRVYRSEVFQVTIGIGICWDQWFPETSRILALMGAEILLFPTAIGSEPQDPTIHSRDHWQRAMCGHAASNLVPVIASNRIGKENEIRFYGSSFITDNTGAKLQEADEEESVILTHAFDLNQLKLDRSSWGLFRDRRPELYDSLTTLDGYGDANMSVPSSTFGNQGFIMPGEWNLHSRCWMLWVPSDTTVWTKESLHQTRSQFAEIAKTIGKYEPVTICCLPSDYESVTKYTAGSSETISIVPLEHDDCWARDTCPTFVINPRTKEVAGVDWIFNGYSNKFSHGKDEKLSRSICAMQGLKRFASPLILEGGSIHSDGEGTLLTTEECLLKRNPQLSKRDIELQLQMFLGISKVIWIPRGVKFDVDTDGHVDNICCFARPGEVILTYPCSKDSFQWERSEEAKKILETSRDARGRLLKVHLLLHPKPIYIQENEVVPGLREQNDVLAASYINFYIANGAIIMPNYENGKGNDEIARQQLQEIFPERKIEGICSTWVLRGGGNIHCITQQQPK